VEFVGEIDERQKQEFLGGALALLFPVDWPEPFGLVMIEALACGTPVVARPCGSVPEILRSGVSGFIESTVEDLVSAVHKVRDLSRRACRDEFERRFTTEVMADNYERVYYDLTGVHRHAQRPIVQAAQKSANAALAREAARRWNPEVNGYRAGSDASRGVVRPLFRNKGENGSKDTGLDS
jgi:hypothetical protein